MRIGYEYLAPDACDTGVGVAIRELLNAQIRLRSNDEFLLYTRPSGVPETLPHGANVTTRLSRVAGLGRLGRVLWQQCVLPLALRHAPVDVYHATGYVASPLLTVPTVVSLYDTIALDNARLTRWLNALNYRFFVPRGIRSAARVLVPSEHVKRRLLASAKAPADIVDVIPLGISERFRPLPALEIEKRLNCIAPRLEGSRYILSVGTLEKKKNLGLLLSAFQHLPQRKTEKLKLALAGKPGNESRAIAECLRKWGLQSDVVLLGYVTDSELVTLYSGAAALVYPSLDEGFGFPPLEAMACGTPAVVSNAGALPETMEGAALLANPHDPKSFVDAIAAVLDEEAVRNRLVALGLARAACLTWQACAARVGSVYQELAPDRAHDHVAAREATL